MSVQGIKKAMTSAVTSAVTTAMASSSNITKADTLPLWVVGIVVVGIVVCLVVWLKYRGTYETRENVADIVASRFGTANEIVQSETSRFGMKKYLAPCVGAQGKEADLCKTDDFSKTLSDTDTILANFYFSTAYMTGCFLPTVSSSANPRDLEYVFSPEAVRFACRGGARAFVLEIWPSQDPRTAYRPILQVVEEGSSWRRISMNTMDFELALQTIVSEIYTTRLGEENRQTQNDMVLLYLRFRGIPRPATYQGVAAALRRHALPYLLDPSFSKCRAQDRLMTTSIRELQGKIVIVANKSVRSLEQEGTSVFPFVNVCEPSPTSGATTLKKVEYTLSELQNLTESDRAVKIKNIASTVSVLAPPQGDSTNTNTWNWGAAYDVGIQCIPMNLFERANGAPYFSVFSRYSYKLKPAELRLKVLVVEKASEIADPGIGTAQLNVTTTLEDGDVCKSLAIKTNDALLEFKTAFNEKLIRIDKESNYDVKRKLWEEDVIPFFWNELGDGSKYNGFSKKLNENNCDLEKFKNLPGIKFLNEMFSNSESNDPVIKLIRKTTDYFSKRK